MKDRELKSFVSDLISKGQEGEYYDFKEKYHENKAALLHDIICMANNQTSNDGYIIFGIKDDNHNVVGVFGDANRKSQNCFVCFLRDKKFSAGTRPTIELRTVFILGKEIDVLIIKNTRHTPYYITEDFCDKDKKVRANYIYTRVCDTNTPIVESADITHVEYLWRKRFGIGLSPNNKLMLLLEKKKEWIDVDNVLHHKENSEFTVCIEYNEESHGMSEFYAYSLTDTSVSYAHVYMKHYGTVLIKRQIVILDGGRLRTVTPTWSFIKKNDQPQNTIPYKYIIEGSEDWIIANFLYDESSYSAVSAHNDYIKCIIVYSSESEKENFEAYIRRSFSCFIKKCEEMSPPYIEEFDGRRKGKVEKEMAYALALNAMLEEWRVQITPPPPSSHPNPPDGGDDAS